MEKHCNAGKDNPCFCQLMRHAGTAAVMCPTLSLLVSILFRVILAAQPLSRLPAIRVGTILKNFPMVFFRNMFATAPFSHWLFGKIYEKRRGLILSLPDSQNRGIFSGAAKFP